MHTLYTLLKSTKIHIKTLKNLPLHVSVPFLRPSSEGLWTLLHDKVSLSKEHQTHIQKDCNDIWTYTAQFYTEHTIKLYQKISAC